MVASWPVRARVRGVRRSAAPFVVLALLLAVAVPGVALAAGTPVATPSAGAAAWPTYHRDNTRAGYLASMPDPGRLAQAWNVSLDGAVYASPLVVGDRVIVATENDSLYALDAASGKILWRTNVGKPVPRSDLPCGDIDPLGITGTPVYDPATGLVFAVAEVTGETGTAHVLVGVALTDGALRQRRSADIPAMGDPTPYQQRAALALSRGMVYVAYGGLFGDCGQYRGTVLAARTDGHGSFLSFQVPTPREGAIWGASGPAINAQGQVFVSVGNGEVTSGNWDHSDSVLRLSPDLKLEDGFAPTQWADDNANDADLGSMGPALLPNGLIFISGKNGTGYLLRADHLGGVGGQLAATSVCRGFGGAASVGSTVFVPCTDGVREVTVTGGTGLSLGWQAPSNINGSPVVGGHTVYVLDATGGMLYGLNM